jgi:hypothetical protein
LSKLYVTPLAGIVTVIKPVEIAQVGGETVVVGAFETLKTALITEGVAVQEFHVYLTIKLCLLVLMIPFQKLLTLGKVLF